jgi:deoxyribonuclease V
MIELQKAIAAKVRIEDDLNEVRLVCGLDVSSNFFQREALLHAAAILVDMDTMKIVEEAAISIEPSCPYRTGFLAFREAPAMIEAITQLSQKPDLLIVDGQGIAHPRRCGIASHLGVLMNLPSIGVAKSLLVGKILGNHLVHQSEIVGSVWHSKKNAKPLFISPGHRVSLSTSLSLVKKMVRGRRLPEPTRLAHERSNRQRFLYSLGSKSCQNS